jgi:hypothetical protein
MEKKFMVVRLQNPEMRLPDGSLANFVVGQEAFIADDESEAISVISEILNGPDARDIALDHPTDFGYTIIPFYK